jgi:hypothetical protein
MDFFEPDLFEVNNKFDTQTLLIKDIPSPRIPFLDLGSDPRPYIIMADLETSPLSCSSKALLISSSA